MTEVGGSEGINTMRKWAFALIALVVLIGVFWPLLTKGSQGTLTLADFNPFARDDVRPADPERNQNVETYYAALVEGIEATQGTDQCFLTVHGFWDIDEWRIDIEQDGDDLFVSLINGQRKIIDQRRIEDLSPCVVAQTSAGIDVAETFFARYLDGESRNPPFHTDVTSVSLTGDWEIVYTLSSGTEVTGEYEASEKENTADVLYVPEPGKVCWLPTNDAENADEDGIDDDWVAEITRRVWRGQLPDCRDQSAEVRI